LPFWLYICLPGKYAISVYGRQVPHLRGHAHPATLLMGTKVKRIPPQVLAQPNTWQPLLNRVLIVVDTAGRAFTGRLKASKKQSPPQLVLVDGRGHKHPLVPGQLEEIILEE